MSTYASYTSVFVLTLYYDGDFALVTEDQSTVRVLNCGNCRIFFGLVALLHSGQGFVFFAVENPYQKRSTDFQKERFAKR